MSVYWRIENWNDEVIQPVNDLATNPPDGCDPVEPLEEAEEDHLFKKSDIKDVHDKLLEICPDNQFTQLETPQLITEDLFTEIEDAIANGWCAECSEQEGPGEGETTCRALGIFTSGVWSHTSYESQCCGEVYTSGFPPPWADIKETTYNTDWHDTHQYDDSNAEAWAILQDSYTRALNAGVNWAHHDQQRLFYEKRIKETEEEIQEIEEDLEILRAQLAACPKDCQPIINEIAAKEAELQILQDLLVEYQAELDEHTAEAATYLQECDAAAVENWTAAGAIKDWNPGIINLVDQMQGISAPWGTGAWGYSYNWSTFKVRSSYNGGREYTVMFGKFTPSGKPFAKNAALLSNVGHECRIQYTIRLKCGLWSANLGICTFGTWYSVEDYDELNPAYLWRAGNTETARVCIAQGTLPGEN